MGGLVTNGRKWRYDSTRQRYVRDGGKEQTGLTLSYEFSKGLKFRKARREFTCSACEKEMPKTTRYVFGQYEKVCCECAEMWIANSIRNFQKVIKQLKETRRELKDISTWRKEMIIGGL